VYHGHRKGVFVYLLDRRLRIRLREFPQRPNPKLDRVRVWAMMLHCPDWSPELFAEVGLTESSVAELGQVLGDYLDVYAPCFSRIEQQQNSETYLKGLLSDLSRKSIEPIALRYRDENAVRTLQMFLKDAPWDDQQMKQLYQDRVVQIASDPNGMITVDGSDFAKKGKRSAGVHRQYCGSKGKIENCQAGVFIGYSGVNGYGLLDAQLYLPHVWFDEAHRAWWPSCDIPDTTEFRTKPQQALEMIQEAFEQRDLSFRWVGCDGAFGCDQAFRQGLPASVHFFADVHSSQHVYRKRPSWALPEHAGRGRKPTRLLPSEPSVLVSTVVDDKTVPWQEVRLMEGAKGPVEPLVKCCRIIEMQDGRDAEELWLYIRQYEDGRIKYALSNAPEDTDIEELHHAATLRWAIEQSFQECKSYLGMSNYETRSYQGWRRHMLLVMVAHLFVLEVRKQFQKKTTSEPEPPRS